MERQEKLSARKAQACEKIVAMGKILMNGETAPWPPEDANGRSISLGCVVSAPHDTTMLAIERPFVVGGLRLQNDRGTLAWVACAYDDASGCYVESYAEDCVVLSDRRGRRWER